MRLKLLYARVLEYLYLRAIQQVGPLPGTDPDDGGHMEVRFGWNDSTGRNRPLFMLIAQHTRRPERTRVLMAPHQIHLLSMYLQESLVKQSTDFGYNPGEAPDWDTRYIRASE